jgi:hypothetical protein
MSKRLVAGVAAFALGFIVTVPTPVMAAERHSTTITLRLSGSLLATGEVRVSDGTHACEARREVVIQKRGSGGHWKAIESKDSRATGAYRIPLPDEGGKYRALVRKLELGPQRGACTRDVSPVVDIGNGGGDGGDNCTTGYSPCLVYHGGADYDCYGGTGDGPYYTEPGVTYNVTGSDPYGLDADNDGRGCE